MPRRSHYLRVLTVRGPGGAATFPSFCCQHAPRIVADAVVSFPIRDTVWLGTNPEG